MADLTKLFVLVPANLDVQVDAVKAKSLEIGNTQKVYFVEKYNQIVAHGVAYGIDPNSSKELSTLLSTLGATVADDGTVSFDLSNLNYKGSATTILGVIEALDAKIKAELDKLAASKTLSTDYEFVGKMQFVAASGEGESAKEAHIALFEKDGVTEIAGTAVTVSQLIGSGIVKSSSYESTTGILTINFVGGYSVQVDLKALFDIDDVVIDDNSKKYLKTEITTTESGEKGIKLATKMVNIADAKANTAEEGQPSNEVTGLVDALDAKTYIDSKVANVNAEGDDYVSAEYDSATSKITVSADVQNVTGTKGTVGAYNNEGAETTAPVHGTLVGVEKALADSAQSMSKVKDYVDGEVAIEAARTDAKILASIKALDKESTPVGENANVHFSYSQADGIVTINDFAIEYTGVTRTEKSGAVGSEGHVAPAITVENGDKLAKGSDVEKVAKYVDDKVAEEIEKLDKAETTVSESGEGAINFKYSEADGIVTIKELGVTYATHTAKTDENPSQIATGIVTGTVLNAVINDLWETWTA